MVHLYYFYIKIQRVLCLTATLSILFASSVFAFPDGSNFHYTFSHDSDGVLERSYGYESSDEEQELPFSYLVNYNTYQEAGSTISEKSLVGRWRKEFVGNQSVTLWTGVAVNNLYTFVPYSAMYDKELSAKEHVWFSFEHATVPTVAAYTAGIHNETYTLTDLHRLNSRMSLSESLSQLNYNDGNQEKILNFTLAQKMNRNLKVSYIYEYDNAKFTDPAMYFVPQGQRVLSIKPEVSLDIGPGMLTAYVQEPAMARNSSGTITYYNYGADYKIGGFSLGYNYTKDDTYTSRVYKALYQVGW